MAQQRYLCVVAPPAGNVAIEHREAWVGCEFPYSDDSGIFPVDLPGLKGYSVPQILAMRVLLPRNRTTAIWLASHGFPFLFRGGGFFFSHNEVEVLTR